MGGAETPTLTDIKLPSNCFLQGLLLLLVVVEEEQQQQKAVQRPPATHPFRAARVGWNGADPDWSERGKG